MHRYNTKFMEDMLGASSTSVKTSSDHRLFVFSSNRLVNARGWEWQTLLQTDALWPRIKWFCFFPILFWPWKRRAEISIAQLCRKSVIIPTHIFAITLTKNIFPVIQELYFVCFARHGIYIKTSTSRELFNRPSKS